MILCVNGGLMFSWFSLHYSHTNTHMIVWDNQKKTPSLTMTMAYMIYLHQFFSVLVRLVGRSVDHHQTTYLFHHNISIVMLCYYRLVIFLNFFSSVLVFSLFTIYCYVQEWREKNVCGGHHHTFWWPFYPDDDDDDDDGPLLPRKKYKEKLNL